MSIIRVKNVNKTFTKSKFNLKTFSSEKEEKTAVENLSLKIQEGEFVGFLGPNGAGKTTFLKMLSGIIFPTDGEIDVLGFKPFERKHEFLKQISIVMGQKNQLWWDLPAIDSYNLLRVVYEIDQRKFKNNLEMMIEILDMKDLLNKRLRNMSLGERMKCELVASLLHDPKVLFLDEPTIGLDVVSSHAIRRFLKKVNEEKKCTLILTSHYMADIDELCKRVVIINKGRNIFDGELTKLKDKYAPEKKIEIYLQNIEDRKKFAHLDSEDKKLSEDKGIIKVNKDSLGALIKEIYSLFNPENISITDIDTEEVITKIFQDNRVINL